MNENKEEVPKFLVFILCLCVVFIIIIAIGIAVFINRPEEVIEKKENGANIILNYSFFINNSILCDTCRLFVLTILIICGKIIESSKIWLFYVDLLNNIIILI